VCSLAVVFEQFIWTQSIELKPSVVERRNLVDRVLRPLPFYRALTLAEKRRLAGDTRPRRALLRARRECEASGSRAAACACEEIMPRAYTRRAHTL
jgi:hypothetical protein